MMMLNNVLVATDFSEASENAVTYARQLARTFGSTLHVVHVVGSFSTAPLGVEAITFDFVSLQQATEEAARRHLDALIAGETLSIKPVVLTSNSPAQAIVSYAQDKAVDLIVVGTHGRGGMAHLFIGSVAERVVRTAPCPVLTVGGHIRTPLPTETHEVGAHA